MWDISSPHFSSFQLLSRVWLFATPMYSPWNSPGQNTGVGSLSLLQGIFPTQDQTHVSCIAGRYFTAWATREAHSFYLDTTFLKISVGLTPSFPSRLLQTSPIPWGPSLTILLNCSLTPNPQHFWSLSVSFLPHLPHSNEWHNFPICYVDYLPWFSFKL